MAQAFLVVSIIGALFTANALRPPRRPESLNFIFFFAAWLTAELPFHHLAWQVVATIVFVSLGALRHWPGWLGLGITLGSWSGLLMLARRSARTDRVMEASLQQVLGAEYRTLIDIERVEAWGPAYRWRQIGLPLPMRDPAVTTVKDIVYTEQSGQPLKLDVYRPADGRQGCPTLLFIHGSAWVVGDKREQGIPMMLRLASHGWVCVTANHRLSPKAVFPEHLLDVKQALRWVREHGAEYGADPDFVVISGASAGGHLAALVALTPNDPQYQPGFEDVDTRVQAAVLFYGVYDLTNRLRARGRGFVWFVERVVMRKKLAQDPEAFAAASPMDLVRPDAPPMLIVHGRNDTLVPVAEAAYFAKLLAEVSTSPVVYTELPGAQHAFDVFPSVRCAEAAAAVERFGEYVYAGHLSKRAGHAPANPTPVDRSPE